MRVCMCVCAQHSPGNWEKIITFKQYSKGIWARIIYTDKYEWSSFKHHHHHHHVVPLARISLTLSRHFSLSFIASGRSSGLHPVSSHSCCMYVRAGRPAFAWPYAGIHRSTSLMSSSFKQVSVNLKKNYEASFNISVFIFGGSLAGGAWGCECLVTHAQRAFLGRSFLPFRFETWREDGRDSEEGFVVPTGCNGCRIENANFLVLHWFKRELSFTLYFSCLAIQVYWVAAVWFCYSHGERSVRRSLPSFEVWRKNLSYLQCCCLPSFY